MIGSIASAAASGGDGGAAAGGGGAVIGGSSASGAAAAGGGGAGAVAPARKPYMYVMHTQQLLSVGEAFMATSVYAGESPSESKFWIRTLAWAKRQQPPIVCDFAEHITTAQLAERFKTVRT